MPLRLLGPTGTVPTVSALHVLGGGAAQALQDKLVVLGYSAETIGDRFLTPFDETTPGAEIIASAISQLIGGATLRHDRQTRWWDVLLSAAFAMLCLAVVIWLPLARAALVLSILLVLYGAAATQAFASGILLSLSLPIVMILPPVLSLGALRLAEARQDAQASARGLAALRRFQSKVLADRLAQDPHYLTTPQSQELFIFFVDLTGFTALSQRLGPEETRILLQDFHNLAAKAVETRGGCVINYMGDGILAVFGLDAPRARASDAKASLAAAAELATAVAEITPADGGAPLACRVGVHVGPVLLSRLGADTHQQVTVSGDTVNLASRLMEVAKTHHAEIVASQAVVDFLQNSEAFGPSRRAKVAIRGRSGEVEVRMWGKSMQTSHQAAAP
jgi:adenylate cyclase